MQGFLSGTASAHAEGIAVLLESTVNRAWASPFEVEMLTVMVFTVVRHAAWLHMALPRIADKGVLMASSLWRA